MAIHFYPKVGGRVDFDTPEEAARFFEITGGGTIEAPKLKVQEPQTEVTSVSESVGNPAPRVRKKKQRLEDSIQIVMGTQEMSAKEILVKLAERGWVPDNSKDPLNYVRTILSSNKDTFRNQSRGRYRLDPTNPYTLGEHQVPLEGQVKPKPTKTKEDQIEPEAEELIVESTKTVILDPQIEDTKSSIEQLSQESIEAPEVIKTPVVSPKLVVRAPEVSGSSDPVADILLEFADELGSLV